MFYCLPNHNCTHPYRAMMLCGSYFTLRNIGAQSRQVPTGSSAWQGAGKGSHMGPCFMMGLQEGRRRLIFLHRQTCTLQPKPLVLLAPRRNWYLTAPHHPTFAPSYFILVPEREKESHHILFLVWKEAPKGAEGRARQTQSQLPSCGPHSPPLGSPL